MMTKTYVGVNEFARFGFKKSVKKIGP